MPYFLSKQGVVAEITDFVVLCGGARIKLGLSTRYTYDGSHSLMTL